MLKMFHRHESTGGDAAFWESVWGDLDSITYAATARRHCEASPLRDLFLQSVRKGRLFIDGGCGKAYWVKYLHDLGYRSAGVDFAQNTLDQLRRIDPSLDLRQGDVRALPFADAEVHVYYSGGVVEHFEDGPIPALREARRVLADDGWFLCSVPDLSPIRDRILYRNATEARAVGGANVVVRRTRQPAVEPADDATTFFQYVFSESEFRPLLAQAGFEVVESFGTSFVWGLLESDSIRTVYDLARRSLTRDTPRDSHGAQSTAAVPMSADSDSTARFAGIRRTLKRVFVQEDRSLPVVGRAVRLATHLAANMRVYVAKPSAR